MKLVWLVNKNEMFECDWIESLFQNVYHHTIIDEYHEDIHTNAVFVFNHTFDYESYFANYLEERVSFGVVHLSDETLGDTCNYLENDSCLFAIRNYYHPIYSLHHKVITVGLGCKSGFTSLHPSHHVWPWYHWCFAGTLHHVERVKALTAFQNMTPYYLMTSKNGFNTTILTIEEYRSMLEISKFALCPIGQGNLDTFRLYEAMEAGCIPVTLASTSSQEYSPSYWHILFKRDTIPFIIGKTWEECFQKVDTILRDPMEYSAMRTKMKTFWNDIKDDWRVRIYDMTIKLESSDSL